MSDVKLQYQGEELVEKLRECATPQDGMSEVVTRGLGLLNMLKDRSLFEVFAQIHIKKIDRERTVARILAALKDRVEWTLENATALAVGFERFTQATASFVESNVPVELSFNDWQNKESIDELEEVDGVIHALKQDLLEFRQSMQGAPIITRIGEMMKSADLYSRIVERRSNLAISTGKRKAPEQTFKHKLGATFQKTMAGSDETDRGKIVDVLGKWVEAMDTYDENEPTT